MSKRIAILLLLLSYGISGRSQDTARWSLQQCLDYAIANNITVKKAQLNVQTAAVNYQQSKNNKLPSVSGSGSMNVSQGFSIDPITSTFVDQTIVSNSYGLSGQFVLYQGSKQNLQIQKNALLKDQSSLYEKEAENSIQLSVIEAYLQALYYYNGITIASNAVNLSAEELKQAETKYSNGAIAQKDLADIKTQHASNVYAVVSARNLYDQQVLKLKQLLELSPAVDFAIKDVQLEDSLVSIPEKQAVFATASSTLPDLKIYDLQEKILGKDLKIAKSGFKPTLSLNAGLNTGYTNTMNYDYGTQVYRNFSQQAGLTLSIPIFSRYSNVTNVKLARINIQQNELDKVSAAKTLYSKIETAWQNATANRAQQVYAKEAKDNAQLSYDLARKKYGFGGLTTTELSVSRNTYLNAEQTYLQSKYLVVLYTSLLNFYKGDTSANIK